MIWVRGAIVPDDALAVSVLDRTFEHGLGLFETFRTWGGRPTLLGRHLDRLRRSADRLGLAIDEAAIPDVEDVRRLLDAEGEDGDRVVRITLTGGVDRETPGTLWMRTRPLATPLIGARVRASWEIAVDDPLGPHKTLNYWRRREVYEQARRDGFDEDLGSSPDGRILEGTRTNVFAERGGMLVTPRFAPDAMLDPCPILPGIMRGAVMERARAIGLTVVERDDLAVDSLEDANELFLTNSGQGIIPVARFGRGRWDTPGPVTTRLMADLDAWLRSEDPR